ncbi:MAG: ABC transporter ATP-binding protein [Hyphomicrobiales bacterium]
MQPIFVENLSKAYGGKPTVQNVSFTINAGETYALLGPNGAGKTTIIEILEGYRRADAGTAGVLGFDPQSGGRAFRERIGILLQTTALELDLTVTETIDAFARFYPKPIARDDLLSLVELTENASKRVSDLSGGQQRRLEIALALVGDPDMLFLDEPTTGLDPDARRNIWHLILELNSFGKTILLSSHYMDEVEALAHRLAVLVEGEICAEGTPQGLVERHGSYSEIRFYLGDGKLPDSFPKPLLKVTNVERGWVIMEVRNPVPVIADLTNWAFSHQFELAHLAVSRPSLEEVYLNLTRGRRAERKELAS